MGQGHLDNSDVDAGRHRSGALICTLAPMRDALVTIEAPDLLFPEIAFKGCKGRCRLAASGWFPCGAHIG